MARTVNPSGARRALGVRDEPEVDAAVSCAESAAVTAQVPATDVGLGLHGMSAELLAAHGKHEQHGDADDHPNPEVIVSTR